MGEKKNFGLKSVIVRTIMNSLDYNETNQTILVTLLLQKIVEKSS